MTLDRLPDPATRPGPDWDDALRAAARALPEDDALAQLFLEHRDDVRVEIPPDARPRVVATTTAGARARVGKPSLRAAFCAFPAPADLERLARGDLGGGVSAPLGEPGSPAPEWRLDDVVGPLQGLRDRAAATGVPLRALWVGFRQRVAVVRAGTSEVFTDLRVGARVRLDVRLGDATAVAERVLRGERLDVDDLLEPLLARVRLLRDAGEAPRGECAVVFAPGVGGILVHEAVGHALEADTVRRTGSALGPRGGTVARPEVTVVDDPRRGRGAWRIDDEGIESRPTPLIEQGRLAGPLHDLASAAADGAEPTGHGRRSSFREPVRPRMGCTFLAPGSLDPREILEDTPGGLYVRRMETASTDARAATARFVVTDADRIDSGALSRAVRPFLLEIRAREAIAGLDRVADDLVFDTCVGSCLRDGQPVVTSVGAPTCRVGVARVVI